MHRETDSTLNILKRTFVLCRQTSLIDFLSVRLSNLHPVLLFGKRIGPHIHSDWFSPLCRDALPQMKPPQPEVLFIERLSHSREGSEAFHESSRLLITPPFTPPPRLGVWASSLTILSHFTHTLTISPGLHIFICATLIDSVLFSPPMLLPFSFIVSSPPESTIAILFYLAFLKSPSVNFSSSRIAPPES